MSQVGTAPVVTGPVTKSRLVNKTFVATKVTAEANRAWWVVDATDKPLGRLASEIARVLRGKHKPTFTTHEDTGDFVIVVNADKVRLTGNKLDGKFYYSHSGIPGGFQAESYRHLMARKPEFPIEKAVKGMLPKNVLGREMLTKLKVYATPDHPHAAQKPSPLPSTTKAKL
jgi:large subunit ribosomal protein L13